jgi:hypothetical protein
VLSRRREVPDRPRLPTAPATPKTPAAPDRPALPDLPAFALPALPEQPALAELPALPRLQELPRLLAVSALPRLQELPRLPALPQRPVLPQPPIEPVFPRPPAVPQLPAMPQAHSLADSPSLPASHCPPDVTGPSTAPALNEFAGPTAVRPGPVSRARPGVMPLPAQPLNPRPRPIDRSATTERTGESAGNGSPAMGTVPSSWLPEPLAGRTPLADGAAAPLGRAVQYAGPPS